MTEFALIDRSDAVVMTYASQPDRIAWPNGDVTQPAAIMEYLDWRFVERVSDLPEETRTLKRGPVKSAVVDGRFVESAVLVDRSAAEITQWDTEHIPAPVSALRFRLALLEASLLDAVERYVSTAPRDVQLAWEFHSEIEFGHPLVRAAASMLNVDDAALRALFARAATLEPGNG